MNRREERHRPVNIERPMLLNIRWDDLTYQGQVNARRAGLKIHWKRDYLAAVCGTPLGYLIWTDEDRDVVSCQLCLSGMEKQSALG